MTAPTPRTIADLDVSESVLLAEIATAHDSQEDLAYREALFLVRHPEVRVSTAVDYPGWVPAHMDPADYARSVRGGFVTPVAWGDCQPEFAARPVADAQTGGAL